MPATLAKSAAPPWAVTLWTDGEQIFAEIPGKDRPYVTVFSHSEGGLSKALNLLRTRHNLHQSPRYLVDNPRASNLKPPPGTTAQHVSAQSILRKMGILP